jgi:glucose/mannose transport system permease protein
MANDLSQESGLLTVEARAAPPAATGGSSRIGGGLDRYLPRLMLSPTVLSTGVFVYGFILWTIYISMSKSRLVPDYRFAGLDQYRRLWLNPDWYVSLHNMVVFAGLYIAISIVLGGLLAIFLDQRIRAEGVIRAIYLYPMALSFIVTGTAWKWILNPGLGIEKFMRDLGFASFTFDWIVNREFVVYTLVIAAVWQASGFVMALFLAALRGVDQEIIRAAHIDGASLPRIYYHIIIPTIRPVFLSAIVVLAHLAIKSFDLVVAMTSGGPGTSSILPANFMYEMTFRRNQLGVGAASSVMMLTAVFAIIVPYFYSELRKKH